MTKDRAVAVYELDVSVIIPALEISDEFLNWVRLLCVQEQTFGFEVLVVLNQPERPLDIDLPANCSVLFCATPGSFATRNVGIRAARGRMLAFTDSDVIPDARWLSEGYAAASTMAFNVLVAGAVKLYHDRKNAVALYDGGFYLQQDKHAVIYGYGATANLWVPAQVFDRIGLFDEELHGSGDVELCWRARDAGYSLIYADTVIVYHPTRATLRDLVTKERRIAGGHLQLKSRTGGDTRLSSALRLEWTMFRDRARAIRASMRGMSALPVQWVNLIVSCARAAEQVLVRTGKKPGRF